MKSADHCDGAPNGPTDQHDVKVTLAARPPAAISMPSGLDSRELIHPSSQSNHTTLKQGRAI
jgi:hypothetical protein